MEKKKVLIVDDQPGIRILLQEVFNIEGFDTFLAQNGTKALEILNNEHIDIDVA